MLDSCLNDSQISESVNQGKIPKVKVPLAGFIVGKRSRPTLVFLQHYHKIKFVILSKGMFCFSFIHEASSI